MLSRREKLMVAGLAYILLAAAFVWFFYLPADKDISGVKDANQRLAQEVELLKKSAASSAPASESAKKALEEMEASFPLKPDQVKVMQVLNSTAKKYNLVLKTVNNSDKSKPLDDKTGQMAFDVTTKGDMNDLLGFIKDLWESGRINNVESIAMTGLNREVAPAAAEGDAANKLDKSQPIYFITPPTAPVAKSIQMPVPPAGKTQTQTAAAAPQPEVRASEKLDPGLFEMKMQVVFYYYNTEKPAADAKTGAVKK